MNGRRNGDYGDGDGDSDGDDNDDDEYEIVRPLAPSPRPGRRACCRLLTVPRQRDDAVRAVARPHASPTLACIQCAHGSGARTAQAGDGAMRWGRMKRGASAGVWLAAMPQAPGQAKNADTQACFSGLSAE